MQGLDFELKDSALKESLREKEKVFGILS